MQMFANCIAQRFRALGVTPWGHVVYFILAHLDKDLQRSVMKLVLLDLVRCGVLVNWRKTTAEPTRRLQVLARNDATLSRDRTLLIKRIFNILDNATTLRLVKWQRLLGHLAYVWLFIGSPCFLLKPLYEAEEDQLVPHEAVRQAWFRNLKTIALRII